MGSTPLWCGALFVGQASRPVHPGKAPPPLPLTLAAVGFVLGLAIAFPVALIIASKLRGLSPWSVSALGLSSVIVMVAAVAAAAQPAARVLRIQPGDIVRSE